MRKIEGYEEISKEKYNELPVTEGLQIWDCYEQKHYYFKRAQKSQRCPGVFIERAALCTIEGIRAICGTDKEYSEYVEKFKREKAQKFPICFKDEWFQYEVNKDFIRIIAENTGTIFRSNYNKSFPLLVKAIEKAKEVMKKNENV